LPSRKRFIEEKLVKITELLPAPVLISWQSSLASIKSSPEDS
jgi:hypothetical protein